MTALYELKRGDRFTIVDHDVRTPPGAIRLGQGNVLTLRSIDGMYSNCFDEYGQTCHPAAWTLVKEVQ